MQALIDRLLAGQRHLGGGMVRVSDFLNHQVDAALLAACGAALAQQWRGAGVTNTIGRLSTAGLAACDPAVLVESTPAEARARCPRAIVGDGRVVAMIALEGGATTVSSPLTIFNGPRQEGHPTVVLHARFEVPTAQTLAVVVPIERRRGEFRYRARLALPPLAAGLGAITRVEVAIGRRFGPSAARRSYVSARCSDGVLRTHGRFSFADGTIVDGSVEKACAARRPRR